MKISCSKNDLLYGINIALRAVPGKTTLPILESFLIDATSDIRIIANDNDMGIETVINGKIETPGKITINARILSDIVRKLPDNQVVIETSVNFKVRITCEDSEFVLNGNNPNEFPELPRENTENKITMSQFLLKELIRQTIFSIAATDANAIMRGELFEVSGDQIKIVSLDSHRISIRKEQLANTYEPCKVIVPGKTLNEISRILGGEKDDPVDITFDKKFIKFSFGSTKVISRLIEGEYFNVDQMISSDYETAVKINRNDFLNTIDRAFTLTREGEKKPIIFDIRDGEINIEISSSLGSMNSHLYIHKDGKDLVIGFNPRFFLEALKVIDDEEVDIFFVNSNAPCFIRDKEGGYIYIILPVNINR
ncbi:MAG: DNA polymerase III subunit beta [Lachnospiraceae bacterium]|nr:DNA polymerase III subunit beta [Lachnospiraceae bacterium]